MTHLINRLEFEIQCPDETQAFDIRHNFSQSYQVQLTEIIDRVCSKYIGEDEWIQIDKLEINLDNLSSLTLNSELPEIFRVEFEKELTQKLSGIPFQKRKNSRQLSQAELLHFFLQSGTLPWWANEEDIKINEIALELLRNNPDELRNFFYKNRFNENIWMRAAMQFKSEVKSLIVCLFEELSGAKELFIHWADRIDNYKNAIINFESDTFKQDSLSDFLLQKAPLIFKNFEHRHNKNPDSIRYVFKNYLLEIFPADKSEIEKIYDAIFFDEENMSAKDAKKSVEESEIILPEKVFQNDSKETLEKYIVRHAGIVLLAPFLKKFYSETGLLNGSEWKNKDSQFKAVHLLKFLSTGLVETPEYALVLEKLLCGVPIDEPVPLVIPMEEMEMIEAESLIKSVIEHWKALKNTSVNGLRESFFKRDGILTRNENDWLLRVERKTLDVLLDGIPWGYSTINLPWNNYIIFVEW